jgi:hypothetical protein
VPYRGPLAGIVTSGLGRRADGRSAVTVAISGLRKPSMPFHLLGHAGPSLIPRQAARMGLREIAGRLRGQSLLDRVATITSAGSTVQGLGRGP